MAAYVDSCFSSIWMMSGASPAATEVESLSQYPAQSVYCGSIVMFSCSASKRAMSSSVMAWRVSLPHHVKLSVTGSSESASVSSGGARAFPRRR